MEEQNQKKSIVLYRFNEAITTLIVPENQEALTNYLSGLFSAICVTQIDGDIEIQIGDVTNISDGIIQYEVKEKYPNKESFCKKMAEEIQKRMKEKQS